MKPLRLQECIPGFVRQKAINHSMLTAIYFDDDSRTERGKVDNVAPDRRLFTEVKTKRL